MQEGAGVRRDGRSLHTLGSLVSVLLAAGCTPGSVDGWNVDDVVMPGSADPADEATGVAPDVVRSGPLVRAGEVPAGVRALDGPSEAPCAWGLFEAPGVTAEDLDGDGDIDLLQARCDTLVVHENLGDDRFASYETWSDPGGRAQVAITLHADGDDRPDVLWLGSGGLRLLRNLGNFDFAEVPGALGLVLPPDEAFARSADPGCMMLHAQVFDAEGDGDGDVLVGGTSRGSLIDDTREGIVSREHMPAWLFLRDEQGFTLDTSFPSVRGATMHAQVDVLSDGSRRVVVLNDFSVAGSQFVRPEIDQPADSAVIVGRPGAWEISHFRDHGLVNNSPMGGVRRDLDGDGVREWVQSRVGGLFAFTEHPTLGLYDATAWLGLSRLASDSVTWAVVPFDVEADGRDELYVVTGRLPEGVPNLSTYRGARDLVLDVPGTSAGVRQRSLDLGAAARRHGRGAVVADVTGDGRADVVVQEVADAAAEAALTIVSPGTGPGRVVQVRFRPGCLAIGAKVSVAPEGQGGRTVYFEPYGDLAAFGNAPTDRLSVGIGSAAWALVGVTWPSGTDWVGRVDADTWYRVPCGA